MAGESSKTDKVIDESLKAMTDFLSDKGLSFDTLTPGKQKRYKKVARAVQRCKDIREQSEQAIKDSTISISSISAITGISNKTFYNDDILNEFVSKNSQQRKKEKPELDADLQRQLEQAKNKISKLIRNAIDTQELKEEKRELEKENENLNVRIAAYEEIIEQLQSEIVNMRTPPECNLIDFEAAKKANESN